MSEPNKTTPPAVSGEIAKYLEIAKSVQQERMRAPLTGVGLDIRIPAKDLISRHAKTTGGQNAKNGYHYGTFPQGDMRKMAYSGYEPVFEDDCTLARNETDVLMRCPTFLYRQIIAANSQRDARVMSGARKKIKADATKKVPGVSTDFSSGMAKVGPAGGKDEDE
jgi:hypothetical protein